MQKDYDKLISLCVEIETPSGLKTTILARIDKEIIMRARIQLALFGIGAITSCVGAGYALNSFITSIQSSGTYEYTSLMFSDSRTLVTYWKEFLLSVIESLPMVTIIVLLVSATLFLWTSAHALRNVKVKHLYGFN